jgi:hypothetical protein
MRELYLPHAPKVVMHTKECNVERQKAEEEAKNNLVLGEKLRYVEYKDCLCSDFYD